MKIIAFNSDTPNKTIIQYVFSGHIIPVLVVDCEYSCQNYLQFSDDNF